MVIGKMCKTVISPMVLDGQATTTVGQKGCRFYDNFGKRTPVLKFFHC